MDHLYNFYDKIISDKEFDIKFINTYRKNNNFLINIYYLFKISILSIKYIKNIEVVSFNSDERAFKYFGPIIYILARLFKKKIIARAFGGSLDIYYSESSKIYKSIFLNTIMKSDIIFLQTKYLIDFFSFLKNSNIIQLPTSRRKISLKTNNTTKKASKFIFTGRVCRDKGIYYVIEAFKNINNNIKIDFYGSVEDNKILELIQNSKNITYKGIIDHKNIYKTLIEYDALILPTFYSGEGYPGSIIEAFQCGLPVIATNWRSIPEIVNNKNGLLISIKSSDSIKKAVLALNKDNILFNSLKIGALKKSYQFDECYWIKNYIRNIKDIV